MSGVLTDAVASVAAGDTLLTAEIYPVANVGKLRITYNWLYSALNCDPDDTSPFLWQLGKVSDDSVTLSPQQPFEGMSLFASVRPDNDDYVEVQAPGSADWITVALGDETLGLGELGLLTINLTGVNGQLLCVNASPTSHDWHSGYLLQSNGSGAGPATNLFLAIVGTDVAELEPLRYSTLSAADVTAALESTGAPDVAGLKLAIDASLAPTIA